MRYNRKVLNIRWIFLLIGIISIIGCKPFYELELSKKQLKRTIKNSVTPIQNGRFTIGENAWSIVVKNKNESILEKDSLVCFTAHIDTCSYMEWTFYNKGNIHQSYIDGCKEPTTGTNTKIYYSYKLSKGKFDEPIIIIRQISPILGKEVKYYFKGVLENTQNVNIPGYIIHLSKI